MTATLADRYVAATLRRVPEKQRPEIERELRAAIADDVDARVGGGAQPADAEYAALTELGDPYRLAAGYTNRPLALIGPDVYPSYVRTLTVLGWTVLPCVLIVTIVIAAAQGKDVWAAIFGPIGLTVQVAVSMAFVVTLLFALLDRSSALGDRDVRSALVWTPDHLPIDIEPPPVKRYSEVISQIVGVLIVVALLLFDRFSPIVTGLDGEAIPVLAPALWQFWVPFFIVLLALTIVLDLVKLRVGRWTVGTTVADTLLGLVGAASVIVVVLTTTVVNPALSRAAVIAPASWLWWIVSIIAALVWVGSTIISWRPAARNRG